MLSPYLALNLYNSKNGSMLQLQYPYQLIVYHPVFLATISRKNFSPQNPQAAKSHKRYQKTIVERFARKTKEANFHFLSRPLMANLNSQRYQDFNKNFRFIMEAIGYSPYLSLSLFSSSVFDSWHHNPLPSENT